MHASALLLAALTAAPLPNDEKPELDYGALAQAFLDRHGVTGARSGMIGLADVLDDNEHYMAVRVGLFDVRVPRAPIAEDTDRAAMFGDCVSALVELQRHWYAWNAREDSDFGARMDDFDTLAGWIDSWNGHKISSFAKSDDKDFMDRLRPGDRQREAHGRIEELMSTGEFLGLALEAEPTTQILFLPGRMDFLEFMCFSGWNDANARATYWKSGIEQWTSFWNENTQCVAMEYPTYPVDMEHPEKGADMNELEKTGLLQHTSEKAAASMFWRYYGTNDALFLEAALAQNLTIAAFGENNVRTGAPVYKNAGGSTSAYEVFVPGGNSTGGTLPARGAITIIDIPLWREDKGDDYYVAALKKAMKYGVKHARKAHDERKGDDRIHFQIHGPKKADKDYVSAPFFGAAAANKELPPTEYLEDYEEFFRAYRAAFFHWLQTRAVDGEEECARRFAALTRRLASRDAETTLEQVVSELYAAPLSSADMEADTLESRFLTWVKKGGR